MRTHRTHVAASRVETGTSATIRGLVLVLLLSLLDLGFTAAPAEASGGALSIKPTTWNIIGLDSSKPSVSNGRPNEFPVGAEVCNTGATMATGLQTTFSWTTSNTNITLATPAAATRSFGSLGPGECTEVTYNVLVNRNHQSFTNRTRGYQITASADGGVTVSTPANRELYVEKLVRQNRNAVLGITSPACAGSSCTVYRGQTYKFTLNAKTATQGYEQLQAFVNFPDSIFEIQDVKTTYAAPKGATNDKVYADGCGWDNGVTSPTYRSCVGPTQYPGGKAGGNPIKTIYTVKVIGTGSGTLGGLAYDFSGSSFHYNADFSSGANSMSFNAVNASDLSISKSHSGAFVRGGTGTYSVVVENGGPAASGTVTVTDTLPAGLTYKSFSGSGWSCSSCSAGSQTVTLTRASLAAGASSTVNLTVDVGAGAASSLTNSATVSQPTSSSLADPVPGNNSTSDKTTVADPGQADLVLTKTRDEVFPPGGTATYLLDVRNDGPGSATGPITVTDVLPEGLTYVSGTGDGWTCSASGQTVTCTRPGGLTALESAPTITLVVAVDEDAPSRSTNTTTATAASNNDPNPSNNVNIEDPVLVGEADLWIEKTHAGSFTRGGPGSYSITVGNHGPNTADSPRVVDSLPSGLSFSSATGTGWTCTHTGQTVVCDSSSDLPAGETLPQLTINVSVAANASASVTNKATVCSVMTSGSVSGCPDQNRGTAEHDSSDNSVEDLTETVLPTDLAVTKSASLSSVSPGTDFTYTVTVTNNGPNQATNVTMVDNLPKHIDPANVSTAPGPSNTSTPPYCDVVNLEVTCVFGTISATAGSNSASATITVRALSSGSGRTLVNTAGAFSDQGDANSANDTGSSSVTITGTLVNAAPTVSDLSGAVSHRSTTGVDFFLSGSDADGDPLTYNLVSSNGGAAHGTVTISGNVATYVPSGDHVGTDSFQYRANDGATNSQPATVTVGLTNTPPTLGSAGLAPESVTSNGTLTATPGSPADEDGDPLTYTYVWKWTSGGNTQTVRTTQSSSATDMLDLASEVAGAKAGDHIEVAITANDGHADSPTRTSSSVEVGNTAPSAASQEASLKEDETKVVTLSGEDDDGDSLDYSVTTLPIQGSLYEGSGTSGAAIESVPFALSGNEVTYVPGQNYNGGDSFEFTTSDDSLSSSPATVSIVVAPVNDAPSSEDGSITVQSGEMASDIDLADLVADLETSAANHDYQIVADPSKGSVALNGSTVTYTRNPGARGSDSFTYKVVDGGDPHGCEGEDTSCSAALESDVAEIDVNLQSGAPSADPQTVELAEDETETITLEGADGEQDPLSFSVESLPQHGSLYDGATATGSPIVSVPSPLTGDEVTYVPDPDYNGADAFDFSSSDGDLSSEEAAVDITVSPVNDTPESEDGDMSVPGGQHSSDIDLADLVADLETSDADHDYQIVADPAKGTVELSGSTATYTRNPGARGSDSFTYKVVDGGDPHGCEGEDPYCSAPLESEVAQIDVTLENGAPQAENAEVSTKSGAPASVPLEGRDEDGDELTFSIVNGPSHGTLGSVEDPACDDGTPIVCSATITYTPQSGYTGTDEFTYVVNDGDGDSSPATVRIDVEPVDEEPEAQCGDPIDVEATGDPVVGTPCGELITVRASVDVKIRARGGNDTIRVSGPGQVRIQAGAGDDDVRCSDASTVVLGKAGNDVIACGAAADTVFGGPHSDRISTGGAQDFASGGSGNDRINSGSGHDRVTGNGGTDRLVGGAGRDVMTGKGGEDILLGSVGNDTMAGGPGKDVGRGDQGNDVMLGGLGPDFLRGVFGIDRLLGGGGMDRMQGGTGPDNLRGGGGRDYLKGRDGDDVLLGSAGADVLRGLPGNDVLRGGLGRNKLDGGVNQDTCSAPGKGNEWVSCERVKTKS